MVNEITAEKIEQAYAKLQPIIRHTPILKGELTTTSLPSPCNLYFKLEHHQLTGSFKIRGVTNKILSTDEEALSNGMVAASGGNHGRAVAYAGWKHQLPTTVFLPITTPNDKIELIKKWGAKIIVAGQDLDEANDIAAQHALLEQALFIHPYADPTVTIGQGTLAVEVLDQLGDLDVIIAAIGGGGLISGISSYIKSKNPQTKVIGVEPTGCPTLYNSIQAGKVVTVPEIKTKVGTLAIRRTTELNFQIVQKNVDEIVLVSDQEMLEASQWLWREFGVAAELSGVAAFAGLLTGKIKVQPDQKVCVLICGVGTEGIL